MASIARLRTFAIALGALLAAAPICAQAPTEHPFFDPDEPLELTLTADFSLLKDDRRGDEAYSDGYASSPSVS